MPAERWKDAVTKPGAVATGCQAQHPDLILGAYCCQFLSLDLTALSVGSVRYRSRFCNDVSFRSRFCNEVAVSWTSADRFMNCAVPRTRAS